MGRILTSARELPIRGLRLVEASAGTGKTELMATLAERALLELGLPPEGLLAVTFTRAATAELRERIRRRLLAAAGSGASADARAPGLAMRARSALAGLDRAGIATIHAFALRVLRDHGLAPPMAGDLAGSLQPLVEGVREDLLRALLADSRPLPAGIAFRLVRAMLTQGLLEGDLILRAPGRLGPWLRRLLRRGRAMLAERKRALAAFGHEDALELLDQALSAPGGETLARELAQRFPVLLVDEFQDTDPRQFRILGAVARAAARAMILVGDPKQAIYGFRGGDLATYLVARKTARVSRLTRNYRSAPGLLRGLDELYRAAGDAGFHALGTPARIRYEALQAAGSRSDGDLAVADPAFDLAPVHLVCGDCEGNRGEGEEKVASAFAGFIADLLALGRTGRATLTVDGQARPLAGRHLAVLVNSHQQAMRMSAALRRQGVAAAAIRRQSVLASAEADELLRVLLGLCSRRDAVWRAALATRLYGFDAASLSTLDESGWQRLLAQRAADRALLLRHGPMALVRQRLMARATALAGHPEGERIHCNFEQLAEILADSGKSGDALAWASRLSSRMRSADELDEVEQLRLESDAERVQVLTVHAAKGLEFPWVFLPFAGARRRDGDDPVRLRAAGGQELWPSPSSLSPRRRRRLEQQQLEAQLRLLYVALTRAQYRVTVGVSLLGSKTPLPAFAQFLGLDGLGSGGPAAAAETLAWQQGLERLRTAASDVLRVAPLPERRHEVDILAPPATPRQPRVPLQARPPPWSAVSFTSLVQTQHLPEPGDERERHPADDASLQGAAFGTLLHAALEQADLSAWLSADPGPGQWQMLAGLTAAEPDPELSQQELARLLRRAAATEVQQGLRLGALPASEVVREMPFCFRLRGVGASALRDLLARHGFPLRHPWRRDWLQGVMRGAIDCVYRHQGRYHLIDYKSNRLPDDAGADSLDAEIEAHDYPLQGLIYALALDLWLRSSLGARSAAEAFGSAALLFLRAPEAACPLRPISVPRELLAELAGLIAAP